jgi:hypothetical protein
LVAKINGEALRRRSTQTSEIIIRDIDVPDQVHSLQVAGTRIRDASKIIFLALTKLGEVLKFTASVLPELGELEKDGEFELSASNESARLRTVCYFDSLISSQSSAFIVMETRSLAR